MGKNKTIDKEKVALAVIQKIQQEQKPIYIETMHVDGYATPEKLKAANNDDMITPDIKVVYENETNIYEIELDDPLSTDKWKICMNYARKNHGNFYLVVPDFLKEQVKEQIKKRKINAGIIFFET